jgi:hypothetical protein
MQKLGFKALSLEKMTTLEGGNKNCKGLSLACGAGLALSLLTGGIGAIIFGPSTVGLCGAAAVECDK